MEEIKIKWEGEYIPLSIFMQVERYKVIPFTKNNQIVYEVSNYGRLRSINTDTGYHGSSFSKTNRCNLILNDERTRVFTAAVVLNAFLGDEFNMGDFIVYNDGNSNNVRLDNVRRLPAGSNVDNLVTNIMRSRYPGHIIKKRKGMEQQAIVKPTSIVHSKLLYNAFKQTILDMFVECRIPTPVSLLYKNAVESSEEIKGIIDFNSFCSLINTKSPLQGDYGQVFLKPANSDMVPRIELGCVSLRLAILLKECYGSKVACYRKKYIVDKENNVIVDFSDTDRYDSSRFICYPAPSYIELVDFLMENNDVFINATYQFEKQRFEGIVINCKNGETTYMHPSDDYDVALENTVVEYLCKEFEFNIDDVEPEDEQDSVETLVDE